MEEGLVGVGTASGPSIVTAAEDDAATSRDWEELNDKEGGGTRFVFPAPARFPPVPRFVGGKRDFPSGEQARINEIQANTFAAFVNICPDFKTITPGTAAAAGSGDHDIRGRRTHRRSGSSSATNDDTLRRRGGSGGTTSITMVPTPTSSDSADYGSVTEEQKRESRRTLLFKGRRKSTNMEQLRTVDKEQEGKGTKRPAKKDSKQRDRSSTSTERQRSNSNSGEEKAVPQRGSGVMMTLSPELTRALHDVKEVAQYKEQMIRKYEQQQETLRGTPAPTVVSSGSSGGGTGTPSMQPPPPVLAPPPPLTVPAMPPPRIAPPPAPSSQEGASLSPIATSPTWELPPPPALSSSPPLPHMATPPPPLGMAPPFVPKTVPVAAKSTPSADELEAEAEAKKWSIKAALRSSIRKSKEDEEESGLGNKYGKHMMVNPLNDA